MWNCVLYKIQMTLLDKICIQTRWDTFGKKWLYHDEGLLLLFFKAYAAELYVCLLASFRLYWWGSQVQKHDFQAPELAGPEYLHTKQVSQMLIAVLSAQRADHLKLKTMA